MSDRLKTFIRQRAAELGFDVCRFASAADAWPAGERLRRFVDEGRHGDMEWMETTLDRRQHPTAMWDEARTAIVLGMNYGPEQNPLDQLADRSAGYISVYARGDDYHEVIKGRLKLLAGQIAARNGADIKVFVDTAPLMEKPLAQRAGLGWQGKHTNLLSRTHGNWLFLGTILTAAEIAPDAAETEHCGRCTACLDACPTKAFPTPFQLDARRCLSYLTIEFAGPWPDEFRTLTGSRIYGCDDCLAVCPWNKFAQEAREIRLAPARPSKARASMTCWRSTTPPSAPCLPRAPSSGSAATASSETSSTPSATRATRPSSPRHKPCWPTPQPWCAAPPSGPCRS